MPTRADIKIGELALNLRNPRTIPQSSEKNAIKAMIDLSPDNFHAILDSIIADGYIEAENIIVFDDKNIRTVREGNRRIAALKLIHGLHKPKDFDIPEQSLQKIKDLPKAWFLANAVVPCLVYKKSEEAKVNQVVSRIHSKGEKAGREDWNSVARARDNRDNKGGREYGLDLLDNFLRRKDTELSDSQRAKWHGDYPLTVLNEALKELSERLDFTKVSDMVMKYPKVDKLVEVNGILRSIGENRIKFSTIRNTERDYLSDYGIAAKIGASKAKAGASPKQPAAKNPSKTSTKGDSAAHAINDPKHVRKQLRNFTPVGNDRQKVVALKNELLDINLEKTPLAFCFLLRSIIEISAYVFCNENNIVTKFTKNGITKDLSLKEILNAVHVKVTINKGDKEMVKYLHSAMSEINNPDRILSVTSMNALVHNKNFTIIPSDVCARFSHVYPILEVMNR